SRRSEGAVRSLPAQMVISGSSMQLPAYCRGPMVAAQPVPASGRKRQVERLADALDSGRNAILRMRLSLELDGDESGVADLGEHARECVVVDLLVEQVTAAEVGLGMQHPQVAQELPHLGPLVRPMEEVAGVEHVFEPRRSDAIV